MSIKAAEYPLYKVFSDEFTFKIPGYQRPYAWTSEQSEELLDDLITALGDSSEKIDQINPYFLGSIVLIKGNNRDADVVDGQQRLTTITILLSVLRTLVPPDFACGITLRLFQPEDLFAGIEKQYRLTLRDRDIKFFRDYIQDENGINKLKILSSNGLSDSQRNIKDNANKLLSKLEKISEPQLIRLGQFIATRCLLVVVTTPDSDSAYRIFSVMNDRGLDLSPTDILKADIIGQISEPQQELYTSQWEDTEEKLGREQFKDLFSHIRMIHRKTKLAGSVIKEFRDYIKPTNHPQGFIDKVLCPLADAFHDIRTSTYESDKRAEEVNGLFKWLRLIDSSDWVPPAILFLSNHLNEPDLLVRFFSDLERLAAGLMIQRSNVNQRIERFSNLLNAIETEEDLFQVNSPLQLTSEEQRSILQNLDGDLYLVQKIRLYVLLRLDAALSASGVAYDHSVITVEHVLPQKPSSESEWITWFPTEEKRQQYVHRLGNLVLLSRAKNGEAQNYEFGKKKEKYFTTKSGVSPFALTTQVLLNQEWTSTIIDRRQKELIDCLKTVWRL